jgi:glycosyltransferase involved in cell wall biosynthesis
LLIINDGSQDKTGEIAEELAKKYPGKITVRHHLENRGLGETLYEAYECAQGELVIQNAMDSPLDLRDLDIMTPLLAEADVIVAVRKSHAGYSRYRLLTSKVNRALLRLLFRPRLRDYNYTQLYKKQVLQAARPTSRNTIFIAPEVIIRAYEMGYRIKEVEIEYHPRLAGKATSGKPTLIIRSLLDMSSFWLKGLFTRKRIIPVEQPAQYSSVPTR